MLFDILLASKMIAAKPTSRIQLEPAEFELAAGQIRTLGLWGQIEAPNSLISPLQSRSIIAAGEPSNVFPSFVFLLVFSSPSIYDLESAI